MFFSYDSTKKQKLGNQLTHTPELTWKCAQERILLSVKVDNLPPFPNFFLFIQKSIFSSNSMNNRKKLLIIYDFLLVMCAHLLWYRRQCQSINNSSHFIDFFIIDDKRNCQKIKKLIKNDGFFLDRLCPLWLLALTGTKKDIVDEKWDEFEYIDDTKREKDPLSMTVVNF